MKHNKKIVEAKLKNKNRLKNCDTILADIQKVIEQHEKDLEEMTAKANEVCPRIEVPLEQTSEVLNREISKLEKQLEIRKKGKRSIQEVHSLWVEARNRYKTISGQIQNSEDIQNRIENSLQSRKKSVSFFLHLISKRTQASFNVFLSQKGYSGDIVFDHINKTLDIKVNLDSSLASAAATLSGGERSFSTVSLLLALWETMELPFCAMDEFDVFMDAVNRQISIEMLLQTGERHRHRQFIFITPQNPSAIRATSIVRIHRMAEPERSQSLLH